MCLDSSFISSQNSFILQVCARCLGIPPETVFIAETSTETVPNSSPSAASMSTDLYGMAVKVGVVQQEEKF